MLAASLEKRFMRISSRSLIPFTGMAFCPPWATAKRLTVSIAIFLAVCSEPVAGLPALSICWKPVGVDRKGLSSGIIALRLAV
jgi:hypothetical protein